MRTRTKKTSYMTKMRSTKKGRPLFFLSGAPQRQQTASERTPLTLFASAPSTVSCVPLTRNLSPADPSPCPCPGVTRLSEATADRIAAHPLYCNVLPEIMCQRHKPELDLDFGIGLQFEALEAVILLDVSEDRLRLYWTIAPVIETSLACQQAFGFSPVSICLMIHLDCPTVRHPFLSFNSQLQDSDFLSQKQ